jgi:hypothetical protein
VSDLIIVVLLQSMEKYERVAINQASKKSNGHVLVTLLYDVGVGFTLAPRSGRSGGMIEATVQYNYSLLTCS